jgi:hypothetical protein
MASPVPEYGIQSLTPSTVHNYVLFDDLAMPYLHLIVIAPLGHIHESVKGACSGEMHYKDG